MCIMMDVVDWSGIGTVCFYAQSRTLCGLEAVNVGVCCARFPGKMRGLMYGVYLRGVFSGVIE